MLTMRVTPKISDRPADRKNNDEAFARPFRPWMRTTSGDRLLLRRAHLPHFRIGGLHRRAVDVAEVGHRALPVAHRGLAHPGAHGPLVVDAPVLDRPGRRIVL